MPVEIKELVIRTVVAAEAAEAEAGAPASAAPLAAGSEQVVEECVRQVLRVLARKQER
jgi:hypothetical protein